MLILSSPNKEQCIKALNKHFYSTTYNINDNNIITWKDNEVKKDLTLVISKGRYKVYHIKV